MVLDPDRLRDAVDEARERLDQAAVRSGRDPGAVELVVAGKYVSADDAPALVAAGVRVVGENRLQDLEAKRAVVDGDLTFDFIGHLQRRKVRAVLPAVRLVHSLDSPELADEIVRRGGGTARVLVEVNVGEERDKYGIFPRQIRAFVDTVSAHDGLVIGGLMAMPPPHLDPEQSRPHLAAVRRMAEDLRAEWQGRHDFQDLSMGTSQDYVVAAEEGATMVRVGRGLIDRARVA
jgi:pyridoxal phosphate enzyme (YggS family)